MDRETFERWRDFATRMARHGLRPGMRRPTRAWVLEMVEDFFYYLAPNEIEAAIDWDDRNNSLCVGDRVLDHLESCRPSFRHLSEEREDLAWEQWGDQWRSPVECCIRAGIDVASAPSMGVMGFTVGDLRRMYPEGLPAWLTDRDWEHGDGRKPVRLATVPDSAGIWL